MIIISSPIFIKDLGMKYPTEESKRKYRYSLYKCYCGNEFEALATKIKSKVFGCGCLNKLKGFKNIKHGLRGHRLYNVWKHMKDRCTNPKNKSYKDYGGRGITICERWLKVENFIEDMYPTFIEGLTIDRIENDGNYEPDNCRWTTKLVQSRNTRKLRTDNISGYRGITKSGKKYISKISVNKTEVYLGIFNTDIDAAKAYDKYVIDNNLEHTRNFK